MEIGDDEGMRLFVEALDIPLSVIVGELEDLLYFYLESLWASFVNDELSLLRFHMLITPIH